MNVWEMQKGCEEPGGRDLDREYLMLYRGSTWSSSNTRSISLKQEMKS